MKEKHKELRKGPSPTQGISKMGAVETKVRESFKESGEIVTMRLRMTTRSKGESECCGIPIS